MTELKLYHFPGACSRVTMTALEEIGCDYADVMINLMAGEHMGDYRQTNPRGKVPALLVDGKLLSENAAILRWLHASYPEAKLFPKPGNDMEEAQQISDLFWISSGWHPTVRAIKMPARWTVGDIDPVRARGTELFKPLIDTLEARLTNQPYYYGENWSIIDVYFYWAYTTAEEGGFSLGGLEAIHRHRALIENRPSFIAMKARENAAKARAA